MTAASQPAEAPAQPPLSRVRLVKRVIKIAAAAVRCSPSSG